MNVSGMRPGGVAGTVAAPTEIHRAAQQFERMLLRTMLTHLEKSAHFGAQGGATSGASLYSSMIVDALADAVTNAGGLGLARKITASMESAGGKT
jgi:Rod binding domain-containing protein